MTRHPDTGMSHVVATIKKLMNKSSSQRIVHPPSGPQKPVIFALNILGYAYQLTHTNFKQNSLETNSCPFGRCSPLLCTAVSCCKLSTKTTSKSVSSHCTLRCRRHPPILSIEQKSETGSIWVGNILIVSGH